MPKCRSAHLASRIALGLRWRNEKHVLFMQLYPLEEVMNAIASKAGPSDYCDDGLRLRHKAQKLRWMGLEREADQLTCQIRELGCQEPIVVPKAHVATD